MKTSEKPDSSAKWRIAPRIMDLSLQAQVLAAVGFSAMLVLAMGGIGFVLVAASDIEHKVLKLIGCGAGVLVAIAVIVAIVMGYGSDREKKA